jgi:pimeloyl-ACP methyl ester carboxylesterase
VPTSFGTVRAYRFAVRRPARAASLALLDPVFTFAPVPVKAMLVSAGMFFPVPEPLRRRVFSWYPGELTSMTRFRRPH